MNRFQQLFATGKKAFIPFFVLGDPTPEISLKLIQTAIETGVDALELGIPFSDPIADGPVIQAAAQRALQAGTDFNTCLQLLQEIRALSEIPMGLLLYYNLLHKRGTGRALPELAAAGADAILAVDLPLESAIEQLSSLPMAGLASIQLIAPNTPLARAEQLIAHSSAFTYVVSDFGTTGIRSELSNRTFERIKTLRTLTTQPLVVGFGISRAEQINALYQAGADGAIIGSAITQLIAEHASQPQHAITAVGDFLQTILSQLQ